MDFTDKTDEAFGTVKTASTNINSVSYRIKDEHTLELRVEISINAFVVNTDNNNFVEDVIVYEDKKIEKNSSALTLYFADKGECVWDIAKRYFTDPQYISEDNELDGEYLENKDMLIIRR